MDHLVSDDEAGREPLRPQNEPYLMEQMPTETELEIMLKRGDEEVIVRFRRRGWYYVLVAPPDRRSVPPGTP